jgi:hypothetical protein
MLSTNEHIPVDASGAYVPSEYTFYLDSQSNDRGSICIPIKLWDRLSGVHQVFVPNFS